MGSSYRLSYNVMVHQATAHTAYFPTDGGAILVTQVCYNGDTKIALSAGVLLIPSFIPYQHM